jgi:hypothetical protein
MSTDYATLNKVHITDLLDGRLEEFGVREHVHPTETTATHKCLTDGRNFLWAYGDKSGFVSVITRYAGNAPGKILGAIAEVFDTGIVSEYEPQFWGFDTQEQWDAAWKELAKKDQDRFYLDLLNFVSNKPHDVKPGTIGEIQAKIAKQLVEADSTLVQPERSEEFLNKIDEIYDREHTVTITLSDQDIALACLLSTHEDDLPQG